MGLEYGRRVRHAQVGHVQQHADTKRTASRVLRLPVPVAHLCRELHVRARSASTDHGDDCRTRSSADTSRGHACDTADFVVHDTIADTSRSRCRCCCCCCIAGAVRPCCSWWRCRCTDACCSQPTIRRSRYWAHRSARLGSRTHCHAPLSACSHASRRDDSPDRIADQQLHQGARADPKDQYHARAARCLEADACYRAVDRRCPSGCGAAASRDRRDRCTSTDCSIGLDGADDAYTNSDTGPAISASSSSSSSSGVGADTDLLDHRFFLSGIARCREQHQHASSHVVQPSQHQSYRINCGHQALGRQCCTECRFLRRCLLRLERVASALAPPKAPQVAPPPPPRAKC